MVTILLAFVAIIAFRFRSRGALELKPIALQHQLAVLHRQRPGRPQDRFLWVLLYQIWPPVIGAMVLVKRATVIEWHRVSGPIGVGDQVVRTAQNSLETCDLIRR